RHPQREDLLELVEHQHRRDGVVLRVPEAAVRTVQQLPQALARARGGRLHPPGGALAQQRAAHLLVVLGAALGVVEPDVHGKEARLPQHGEEAGPEQRALAQPRHPVEQRERLAADQAQQVFALLVTAVEVLLRRLGKGDQPRPGVLPVDDGRVPQQGGRRVGRPGEGGDGAHGCTREAVRTRRTWAATWLMNSEVTPPPGSEVAWQAQNVSGTPSLFMARSSTITGTMNGSSAAIRCLRLTAWFHSPRKYPSRRPAAVRESTGTKSEHLLMLRRIFRS